MMLLYTPFPMNTTVSILNLSPMISNPSLLLSSNTQHVSMSITSWMYFLIELNLSSFDHGIIQRRLCKLWTLKCFEQHLWLRNFISHRYHSIQIFSLERSNSGYVHLCQLKHQQRLFWCRQKGRGKILESFLNVHLSNVQILFSFLCYGSKVEK